MIYLPVSVAELARFRDDGTTSPARAFGATGTLREAFGYTDSMAEDAEHAAQLFASLCCLVRGQQRLVVAAEVDLRTMPPGEEPDFGDVVIAKVAWSDVRAIFADEPEARPRLAAYAAEHAGQSLEQAWEDEATAALLGEHDLLWYAPSEYRALVERLSAEGNPA